MEFKDLIASRHSVRKFTDTPIDRQILEDMVSEAMLAPSSRNSRSSVFLIVDDRKTLGLMSGMRDYGSGFMADAAAAIVVLGDTSKTDLWLDNAAISATYLLMSAVDKGLGACWVHINGRPQFREDPIKGTAEDYLRNLLGIDTRLKPLCAIALGYEKK